MLSPGRDIQTTDISEFQNELDRKDLIIKNLQNQLLNFKSQKSEIGLNPKIFSELKCESSRKDREIQILNEKIFELNSELKEANAKLECYELKENFNKNESGNLLEISEMKIDKINIGNLNKWDASKIKLKQNAFSQANENIIIGGSNENQ